MADWSRAYPAPAKLNLFLHVVGRRSDGYHLLQTVFRLIDFGDTLRFSPRADGRVARIEPLPGVAEDDDLTVRAARLLQREASCSRGVDIALEKRLPMGGGVGGGSSDAATVLLALNHLWGIRFPSQRLQVLALQLGADVPFFVFGLNAFAEGVGEVLQAVDLPPAWYVLVAPLANVSTQAIFTAPELTRNTNPIKMADFSAAWCGKAGAAVAAGSSGAKLFGRNDLEAVVCKRYPEVARAIAWLGRFAEARMTGSGAGVFASFVSEQDARAVLAQAPQGMRAWVARGLDEHPLRALVQAAN